MSDRRYLLLTLATILLSTACFQVPATKLGRLPLDAKVLGEWDCRPAEPTTEASALVTFLRFDEFQYYVEWKEGEKLYRYRVYPGHLRGIKILNVAELPESDHRLWMVARASLGVDGVLSLAVPAKRITDMSDDDARLRAFRREADRADAWEDFARCVAHKDASP